MLTEARKRANEKYIAANYARIALSVKKEVKQEWEKFAQEQGESLNGMIKKSVEEYMKKKSWES